MDTDPVIIEPPIEPPVPLVYNDTTDTSNMTNVVLIDSMVADNNELYDSVNANTFPIIYNYNCKTDDLLALFRQKFPASSIQRIALMFHGRENGEFIAPFMNNKLLFEEGDLADNQTSFSENVSFLISCIKEFHVGHIDFLACSTLMHSNWKKYYALLVSQTSVVVGASNDATGNVQYGGNWVMESTGEDIKQTYFTNSIDYYKYLLANYQVYQLNGLYYMCNVVTNQYYGTSTAYVSGTYSIGPNVVIPTSFVASFILFNNNYVTYVVTAIGDNAFQNNNVILQVSIPDSVTSIGTYAFQNSTLSQNLTISNYVTGIGWGAFENCRIPSLSIGSGVQIIPNYMCFNNPSLTSISLPSSLTTIKAHAFDNCTSLSSITIPNSVTSIEENVFFDCTNLYSATIGTSVASIGVNAFQNCSRLPSIIIPNSVTSIQDYTFQNCASLTSATIGTSVTSIGTYAFASCTSLTSVSIPASVTSIGPQGFDYCTSVTAYSVNSSNNYYSNDAFGVLFNKDKSVLVQYPLGNTQTIYNIPSSVTSIIDSAFDAATKLTIVSIPASVVSIGGYGFNNCYGLTSVSIPSSVTSIGGYGFNGCSNLNLVYFLQTSTSSIPTIGTNAFNSIKTPSVGKYYSGVANTSRIAPPVFTAISPISNTIPTLTSITPPFTGNENVLSVISYTDLQTNGDEVVNNPPFVYLVNSITNGSLTIGTTQGNATPWNASTNKTIYQGYNAYWTPPTGVSGTTNAFSVVIQDATGTLSSPNVQVQVNLRPPTLTSITAFTGNENVLSVISYSNLVTNGNEVVYIIPFVYLVNSVTSGSLTIGTTQGNATPWNASSNYTIDASKNAYWTPPPGVSGTTNAFMVVIQDFAGAVSSPNVQVQVNLSATPCFKKGTKILCENDMYIPIENLKIGDLVKTYKYGYQKIIMCAQIMRVHSNLCDSAKNRINQLYTYSRKKNPKLIEDLHLTGGHSLLLNKLTKDESNDMKQIPWTDDEFIVEDKYKLLACFSSKLCIATEQNVEIYHFTLEPPENAKPSYVYGVYANGILVESCSKGAMEEALGNNRML